MKSLFYKEMKLCMHPVIWTFMVLFPLMSLIPEYPAVVSFIYVLSTYPILFLGANKGVQSNDIYFSCLLPIRRDEIIKARMLTTTFIQAINLALFSALLPAQSYILSQNLEFTEVGLGPSTWGPLIGLVLVCYGIYDFIYFALFYRNGRSVVLSTFTGIFSFILVAGIFSIAIPLIFEELYNFLLNIDILGNLIFILVGLVIWIALHFATLKLSVKLFKKVDF